MGAEITDKIVGYHYTNQKNYKSIQTEGIDNFITPGFDNFKGLIPRKRFIRYGEGNKLPREAYRGIVEGLFEPEPQSWIKNPKFPQLWNCLMGDICREREVILLSFELKKDDKAYVVERAHVERELYREFKGQKKSTTRTKNKALKKYWDSRVPVFEYDGSYSVPQLAIWSGIEFDRLKVEWVKSSDEVLDRVIKNNW